MPCGDAMLESKDKDEDVDSKLLLAVGDWGAENMPRVQQAAESRSAVTGEGRTADREGERLGSGGGSR